MKALRINVHDSVRVKDGLVKHKVVLRAIETPFFPEIACVHNATTLNWAPLMARAPSCGLTITSRVAAF